VVIAVTGSSRDMSRYTIHIHITYLGRRTAHLWDVSDTNPAPTVAVAALLIRLQFSCRQLASSLRRCNQQHAFSLALLSLPSLGALSSGTVSCCTKYCRYLTSSILCCNGAKFKTVSISCVQAVRQCYWSPIAVLRHPNVQEVCLRQYLGVLRDRARPKQRRLFLDTQFDVLTTVSQFYCTQFLSIRTAMQTTLQFAGYLRHHCIAV
jgi:hypothetical protein